MRQLIRFRKKLNESYSPHELSTISDTVLRPVKFYCSNKKDIPKEISFVLQLTAPHFQSHIIIYEKFAILRLWEKDQNFFISSLACETKMKQWQPNCAKAKDLEFGLVCYAD